MATSATVPMFDPGGQVRMIPSDQAAAAAQAGGKPAVKMTDPTGTARWIPADQKDAAIQAGGKLAQDAAQPAATPHWYDAAQKELGDLGEGFTTSMSQVGTTADKLATKIPLVGPALANNPTFQGFQADDQRRAARPLDTPGKMAGAAIENILEFAGGDEALKGLSVAEKVAKLGGIARTIEKYPAIARIVSEGARQGAVGAGQAAAHGESAGDALTTGAVTGAVGGGMSAAVEGVGALVKRAAPGVRSIAGVDIPELASQRGGGGANIADVPEVQAKQQAGGQEVHRDMAQKATQDSLDRLNATRQPLPAETNPARMLPAPADAKPYQFSMDVDAPPETPQTTPPGRRIVPGDPADRFSGNRQMAAAEWQHLPPETGQIETSNGRGATATTSDPSVAHATLSRMDDLIESDSFGNLSPTQQTKIQAAADGLRKQIEDQGAYAAKAPNFAPVDSAAAAGRVSNFRDAAAQIEAAAQPTYSKLDQLSGGKFQPLRDAEKAALKVTRNPSSTSAYDAAQQRIADSRDGMAQIFADHRGDIKPEELTAANAAWKDASTLKDIHAALEGSFNGVPQGVADRTGIARTMKGGPAAYRRLSSLLDKRGTDVTRVIGQDGVDNLYQVAELLKNPNSAENAKGLMGQIGMLARRHTGGMGALIGGSLASTAGHVLGHGIGFGEGAIAGAATEAAYKRVLHHVATHPEVAARVATAVKNNVSHRIAAPLIASMMMQNSAPAPQTAPQP